MGRKQEASYAKVRKALIETNGAVYLAAKMIGCHATTIYNRMQEYPDLQILIDDMRGAVIDTAENKLLKAIECDQPWAIAFVLRTIGKHRGYVQDVRDGTEREHIKEKIIEIRID